MPIWMIAEEVRAGVDAEIVRMPHKSITGRKDKKIKVIELIDS